MRPVLLPVPVSAAVRVAGDSAAAAGAGDGGSADGVLRAGVGDGLGASGFAPGAAGFRSSTGAGLSTFRPSAGTSIHRETFPSPYDSRVLNGRDLTSGSWRTVMLYSASVPVASAAPPTLYPSGVTVSFQPVGASLRVTASGVMPSGRTTRSSVMPAVSDSASEVKDNVTFSARARGSEALTSACAAAG